ncbi:hypothetical protein A8U91_02185 [Halomonas elongata]|uniref:TRAP transporter solute receptor, TAXI family n=1 Tax=Halomonas elongata TaxID=2746 RepID=A0A1B8P6C2_HALEL|nr:hypothetical protein A8U91_02185 [Halomonas elongata]
MDEELAYQITKTLFEHTDQLIAIHPAANDTTMKFSVDSTPIAFHPGALRYYEEQGPRSRIVSVREGATNPTDSGAGSRVRPAAVAGMGAGVAAGAGRLPGV